MFNAQFYPVQFRVTAKFTAPVLLNLPVPFNRDETALAFPFNWGAFNRGSYLHITFDFS